MTNDYLLAMYQIKIERILYSLVPHVYAPRCLPYMASSSSSSIQLVLWTKPVETDNTQGFI